MSLFEEYIEGLNKGIDGPLLWIGASLEPLDPATLVEARYRP